MEHLEHSGCVEPCIDADDVAGSPLETSHCAVSCVVLYLPRCTRLKGGGVGGKNSTLLLDRKRRKKKRESGRKGGEGKR